MSLRDDMQLLQAFPIFSVMEAEALQLVAFSAETRFLRTNDTLFRRGDHADAAYIVTSGQMLVSTPAGNPMTAIRGAMIAETALFTDTEYYGTALAQETTSLMRIPRLVMRRVLEEFPNTAVAVLKVLRTRSDRLHRDLQRIALTVEDIR